MTDRPDPTDTIEAVTNGETKTLAGGVRDETVPGDRWVFGEAETAAFADMLARSIPDYENLRRLCFEVGRAFVRTDAGDGWLLDLGASRGEAVAEFVRSYGATIRYTLAEVAPPMIEAIESRFGGYIESGRMDVFDGDLATAFPSRPYTLALSVLTLQFIPINHRQQILRRIWESLRPGGALILVEKVLGQGSTLDSLFVGEYHAMKQANGYSPDTVERKRLALEGVLVPVTASINESFLRDAGFTAVDCFWRRLNFAGWIAVKER